MKGLFLDTNIIIDVSDTGKGISAQNISKVFKPGFTTKKPPLIQLVVKPISQFPPAKPSQRGAFTEETFRLTVVPLSTSVATVLSGRLPRTNVPAPVLEPQVITGYTPI